MLKFIELRIKSIRNLYTSISLRMNISRSRSKGSDLWERGNAKIMTLIHAENLLSPLVTSLSTKSLKSNNICKRKLCWKRKTLSETLLRQSTVIDHRAVSKATLQTSFSLEPRPGPVTQTPSTMTAKVRLILCINFNSLSKKRKIKLLKAKFHSKNSQLMTL